MLSACLLTLSTGCASFVNPRPLPDLPEDLAACAEAPVVDILEGSKSRAETADLVARIRASELYKDKCSRALLAWYESLLAAQS